MSASIRLYGATSGYIELKAPDVAGDQVIDLGELLASATDRVQVVEHGLDEMTVRPTLAKAVYWKGEVAPENAIDGDLWFDTSGEYDV